MSNTAGNIREHGNNTQNLLNNTNSNLNSSGNTSAATLLLTNLLQNLSDKENNNNHYQKSLIQTQGLKSDSSTNALYQFLKNKHLSREIQKRGGSTNNESFVGATHQSMKQMSKTGSRACIDLNDLKKEDDQNQSSSLIIN
jgi:hypothetical protein